MAINLTIIDRHTIPEQDFIHHPKVNVVLGYDQDNYYSNVKQYVDKQFDYVFYDENPDAMIAAGIYLLGRENPPPHKCLTRGIKSADFQKLTDAGKESIAVFNTLNTYYCDLDAVDSVTLINPHESGLQNISVSQILYKASEIPNSSIRDLAGIAIILDYSLDEAFETIVEIVSAYPDVFADLAERIKNITLNKYNVHDSAFGELSMLFRAPSIIHGTKGVEAVIHQLINNPPFQLPDLLNGSSNKTIEYLQKCLAEYKKILSDEQSFFEKEKIVRGPVVIYSPHYHSENFVKEFSNLIKDASVDSVIIVKTPTENSMTKYSIRRGELEINLGEILKDLGVGGGNPFAAGCNVRNEEEFEKDFFRKLEAWGIA